MYSIYLFIELFFNELLGFSFFSSFFLSFLSFFFLRYMKGWRMSDRQTDRELKQRQTDRQMKQKQRAGTEPAHKRSTWTAIFQLLCQGFLPPPLLPNNITTTTAHQFPPPPATEQSGGLLQNNNGSSTANVWLREWVIERRRPYHSKCQ